MTQSLQSLLDSGVQLLISRRLEEAHKLSETLLNRYPGNQQVHLFAADAADARGDRNAAIAHLESLPKTEPVSAPVLLRKAQLLYAERRRADARSAALAAAGCMESDVWQLRTLARVLSDCQDVDGARAWLQRAHEMFPTSAPILFDLAVADFQLYRVNEAEQHLEALLKIEPLHPGALHLRSMLDTQTPERNHIDDLEGRLARGSQHANLVTACCFALAKEHEDLQQYDSSFSALGRGARAYRSTLKYDSQNELAAHTAIRTGFTREALLSFGAGFESEGPIFIVGMPRTGTTLVERMLSSHSQVKSVGELSDFPLLLTELVQEKLTEIPDNVPDIDVSLMVDCHELGRRYVAAARQLVGDSRYFVDKLPYNFLYCGYILAALPKAKVIHLTRDPMDTCYAVYKTLFFGAYSFSYDLDELADYYASYRRHMSHWHQVLPGHILDVAYESLVQDPQTQARRILDWCGLPWEESVLAFDREDRPAMTASAIQIRKPIYTHSIGAWRRVEHELEPLRDRLNRAGLLQPPDASGGP